MLHELYHILQKKDRKNVMNHFHGKRRKKYLHILHVYDKMPEICAPTTESTYIGP